ncbi:MAG TPA: hypothetical protein GX404_04995, partial [Syntrophomonadaceae bacterium]|nr:hypothetical protein [Syntrophomonadaceae bacterium]
LLQGKEVLVQADIDGAKGQAFTADPVSYQGSIESLLSIDEKRPGYQALMIAVLNAAARKMGLVDHTVHCKNEEPEQCAVQISRTIAERHGLDCHIGIIGYQPAILEHCVKTFGADQVHISDLDLANIGQTRYGVLVWDGMKYTEKLIETADVLLITGSVLSNNTAEKILTLLGSKPFYFFGTTAATLVHINGWQRLCFQST